jgi:cell division protein FtsL
MGAQMIRSSEQADQYNKKRKHIRLLALLSVGFVAIIAIVMTILKVETTYFTLISFFLLIGLLVVIFILKPKLMFYAMHYRYHMLLANSNQPQKVKTKFDSEWIDNLLKLKFQYGAKHDYFDVFYRITKPIERSAFHANHILEIITVIKDNNMDFYSDQLNDEYKRLWVEHQAKYRISKQVIMQFKKYDDYHDSIKDDFDRVIAFNEGSNYFISINCGYFQNQRTLYYLHSDLFYPNLYYKYAVDLIKQITN